MPFFRGTRLAGLPIRTWYPTYWLYDEFNTDTAAPLTSPRTADPGPGSSIIVTDTNSKLSISGGKASFATGGSAVGNPGYWGAQQTRATGKVVAGTLTQSAQTFEFGWDNDQAGTTSYDCLRLNTSGSAIRDAGTAVDIGLTLTGGPYYFALVQRTTGFWAFIKGLGIPSWKLVWVGNTSTGNLYPAMMTGSTTFVGNVDNIRGTDLIAPLNDDYGFAHVRLSGARSAGDTFDLPANVYIEWTQTTLPSSGNTDIRFREVDASNYMQALVSSTGAITVNSVTAGVPTQVFTTAAAIANGNRVALTADGSTLRFYAAAVTKGNGTSAAFTAAKIGEINALGTGGAVSDFVAWPIYPNPNISRVLNVIVG